MKTCQKCGKRRQDRSFYRRADRKSGLQSHCKDCQSKSAQEWANKNPERHKKNYARYRRRFLYGISEEEFVALKKSQKGRCAICDRRPKKFHVDHNHRTGEVRGLLCPKCNLGLGLFDESPAHLLLAVAYLNG